MTKKKIRTQGRLAFDPARMAAPPESPAKADAEKDRPLRVRDLAGLINEALRSGVPRPVRVVGEVTGFRDRTHWWFNLTDDEATISCVMFASAAKSVRFSPEDGVEVVVSGRVEHYAEQGRTQLYVTKLEPVGAGAMDARLRALMEELRARGYFDPERKRPLPWFPRRVAVITSRTGAALQDVLSTMKKRCPAVDVAVIDALVQGPGAVAGVVGALGMIANRHELLGIDAVILTRGGGSAEDLGAFNDRAIAEAIVRCPVPVVAAIGHETDTTIAELVADERCATPTQAAVRLTPDREQVGVQLESLSRRLRAAARGAMHSRRLAVSTLAERLGARRPERIYAQRRIALADAGLRLDAALRGRVARVDLLALRARLDRAAQGAVRLRAERLRGAARSLEAVGPASVLSRGFSVTFGPDGRAVKSPKQVKIGDRVRTRVREGEFVSIVGDEQPDRASRPKPAPGGKRPRGDDEGLDLFGGQR